MSDLGQVQTILRSIYTHCTTLCEFTEQAGYVRFSSSAKPKHCRQLKNLCCKILVATNNPNCFIALNRDRFSRDVKSVNVLSIEELSCGGVTLQRALDTLGASSSLMSRKDICLFFPLGNSSSLQITGVPIYNTMPKSTVAVSHSMPSNKGGGGLVLLHPRVQTESDNDLETASKCDNSSIVNDAAMFVSMLDDSEDGEASAEIDVKETDNEVIGNSTGASMMEFVGGCVSSEELFSSATTANDSVIIVSSNSAAMTQPAHAQNTAPIHGIERVQEVIAPSDNHSTPLFSSNGSAVMNTADSPTKSNGEPMDIEKPTSDSNCISNISLSNHQSSDVITSDSSDSSSDGELSGSSNDDTEFLSNSLYQLRKRKIPPEIASAKSKKARKTFTVTVKTSHASMMHSRKRRKKKSKKTRGGLKKDRKRKGDTVVLINKVTMCYAADLKESYSRQYILNRYSESSSDARQLVAMIFFSRGSTRPGASSVHPEKVRLPVPRRLNTAVSHFTKLLSNHRHKVPYHVLLNLYCPVSAECPGNHGDEETTSVLRNLVSEHLSHDQGEGKGGYPPLGLKFTKGILDKSEQEYMKGVLGFLKSVLRRLVPLELWGSKYNRRVFYRHLRKFLQLRRRETLSVKQMCEGVKFSHCDWLKLPPPKHKGRPHPPQRRLFERLIHWLMTGVVIRTLKAFFYVTEHSEHQNCLFYYRKKVWSRIQELAVRIIPYQQIPLEEVQHHVHFGHTLGISKLRFLPKTKGVRPIVNFRSKINLSGHPQLLSVNDQLRDVFHVLNYEKSARPEIIASSCFGLHEVFIKLKRFSTEQNKVDTPTKGPLLFVRVDISSCYDSMVPKRALEIVSKNVLSQRSYLIRCFAKLFVSRERVQRLFLRAATAKVNSPSFFKFAKQQAKNHSNCIFVDKSLCIEIKKDKVKSLLQKHLFGNLVKLGNDYYKQVQGIAHGAKLSTLLCGFYYADMEQNCVLPTVDPSKGLLMRYVDDFLLITREVGVAREFLTTMQRGVAEYNCTINPAKTVTNFKLGKDEEIEYLENVEWVKWCGLLLNTKTLDVMADFSIYTSKNIRDNMTIALHSKHFSYLRHFSRRIIRLKCMPVLLDAQVVTNKTAVVNIYQGFLIASYKYLTVLLSMPNGNKMAYPCKRGGFTRKDFLFFFKTAVKMFAYFWQLAQNRGVSNPFLNESVCVWLGCHAFKKVLIQHQPHKKLFLIHLLAQKLESLSNRLGSKMLRLLASAYKISRSKNIHTVQFSD